jgi:hypothetical protein
LLTIVLGDTDWFEALRVLVAVEASREGGEAIVVVPRRDTRGFCSFSPPIVYDGSGIAPGVDLLPKVGSRKLFEL